MPPQAVNYSMPVFQRNNQRIYLGSALTLIYQGVHLELFPEVVPFSTLFLMSTRNNLRVAVVATA